MKDFIQIKKENILKIGIKNDNGEDTGEFLEFDTADIELPLKLNRCEAEHNKNLNVIKMKFIAIEKREDKVGKYLLSFNQEEKCKLLIEHYKREADTLDIFLGENGTKKMLAGRNYYWDMYDDINKALKPILPQLKLSLDDVANKIKNKYTENKENVLK